MTKKEKKIIVGLYLYNQMVDDKGIVYYAPELYWLTENKQLSKAKDWKDSNGKLKSVENDSNQKGNYMTKSPLTTGTVKKALSYLKGKHYIDYDERGIGSYKIRLTINGCEIARELQTRQGRFNFWYKENKDGIYGLLITIFVSAVVSLIVALVSSK